MTKSSSQTSPDAANRLTDDLSCSKKSLGRARSKIIKFASEHGFSDEAEDIALATQEALKNVIQHACPADNSMHLECTVDHDNMVIEVSDLGKGFDVSGAMEAPTSPMASHGRGIRLIRGLMDELWISSEQEGTLVHMEKKHRGAR